MVYLLHEDSNGWCVVVFDPLQRDSLGKQRSVHVPGFTSVLVRILYANVPKNGEIAENGEVADGLTEPTLSAKRKSMYLYRSRPSFC